LIKSDIIGHKFPGGSFLIDKDINNLVNKSTGKIDSLDKSNDSHQIFSMIALSNIGYTLQEFFDFLNYDVNKGPMLGECDIKFYYPLKLNKNYDVQGIIESLEFKRSKKIGDIDIMKFRIDILHNYKIITEILYTWILPR